MEKRSEYRFSSYDAYENAKDAIYHASPSAYDKLVWEGKYGDYYYVALYDDLERDEVELVASRIAEFGGKYFPF